MIVWTTPCPTCARGVRVEVRTDRNGRTLPDVLLDACEHERKRRGVCKLCLRPVYGKPKVALYCERHNPSVQARRRRIARSRAAEQEIREREQYPQQAA